MEHVLAKSRLFVALMSLGAWLFRVRGHAAAYPVSLLALLAYVLTSLSLLLWVEKPRELSPDFGKWAHVNDLGWPALLCFGSEIPNTVIFVLLSFAIIAAAFRWGFAATLATVRRTSGRKAGLRPKRNAGPRPR